MDLEGLIKIMDALREGCPWDREQTRESLKPYLIEEAYELLEALEEGEPAKIKEELGDLLFQIVFHSRIASERGEFQMKDVVEAISEKMRLRHPHVFGDEKYSTAGEVAAHWEEQKKKEGKLRGSLLEGVPGALPSLLRAHRLQDRAAKVGFDWESVTDAIIKLDEEIAEFKEALSENDKEHIEEELGDIFFMLVNISRIAKVNPEDALRRTISKFISRFGYMEAKAAESGWRLQDMTLEDMDKLWEESKGGHSPL